MIAELAAAYCSKHFRSIDDNARTHVFQFAADIEQAVANQAPTTLEQRTYADGTVATGSAPLPEKSPDGADTVSVEPNSGQPEPDAQPTEAA